MTDWQYDVVTRTYSSALGVVYRRDAGWYSRGAHGVIQGPYRLLREAQQSVEPEVGDTEIEANAVALAQVALAAGYSDAQVVRWLVAEHGVRADKARLRVAKARELASA